MIILFTPMWDNETERLAWRKCSLTAARLRVHSDNLTLLAIGYAIAAMFWHLPLMGAVLIWALGRVLCHYAYKIMLLREFKYDGERIEARWRDELGEMRIYTHDDYQRDLSLNKQ